MPGGQADRGRAPRRTACPAPPARRTPCGGRRPRHRPAPPRRAGGRPRRCWRRSGPAARARRRGSRRSGRRRCRRSRRRSTACTAPCPGAILPRSLLSVALTCAAAPGPLTIALPRWLTSKMPTASRTAVCSLTTPEGYSSGMHQPPNSANFAPSATCRSCSGDCEEVGHGANLTQTGDRSPWLECAGDVVPPAQREPRQDPFRRRRGRSRAVRARTCGSPPVREDVAEAYGRKLRPLLSTLGFTGKPGEVVKVPTGGRDLLARCWSSSASGDDPGTSPYAARPASRRGRSATPPRSRSRCPPTRPELVAP